MKTKGHRVSGVRIPEGFALEILQEQIIAVATDDGFRGQHDLSAAARGIDDIRGCGVTGCMSAEPLNDFESLRDGSAEVR